MKVDKYRNMLYSKNGYSTMMLANQFLLYNEGDKIPTVSELSEDIGLARGTIQNALKLLVEQQGIILESRGNLGTFLKKRNIHVLLAFAGINSIVGVMPLPYSKKYEGLATGLITALENQYQISTSLAYMRGAQNRISMLLADRYDFAVVSKHAAEEIILNKKLPLKIIKTFGKNSYLSNHVLMFYNKNNYEVQDGMRIGVDKESIDIIDLSDQVCKGKKVEYIYINYSNIADSVMKGFVDAAIWNEDDIKEKNLDIHYIPIKVENTTDTEAVLVVKEDNNAIHALLSKMITVDTVLEIQKLVVQGKISPSY